MPNAQQDPYAASCNPSRRAKRLRADSLSETIPPDAASSSLTPTPLLLKQPTGATKPTPTTKSNNEVLAAPEASPNTPNKRGRKPGGLSRNAREAQRKLNHSIIEKARRTKINDALATLRQLVPAEYGSSLNKQEPNGNEEDGDYEGGSKKERARNKAPGKREEKEKEFKLEILIRTVSFMQELLNRVAVLEAGGTPLGCRKCEGKSEGSLKRKRDVMDQGEGHQCHDEVAVPNTAVQSSSTTSAGDGPKVDEPCAQPHSSALETRSRSRLPSISSWLLNSEIDPCLLPPEQHRESPSQPAPFYLPSPPLSTRFDPVRTPHVPPALNLGPVATSALLSPMRTPEDETAASLLLQISASSPPFLPLSLSTLSSGGSFSLPKPSLPAFTMHGSGVSSYVHAQTPSSILGLTQSRRA